MDRSSFERRQRLRHQRMRGLRQSFVAALPIVAGYVVLGIPCGILGVQAGMSLLQIALMSLLFYSGAGQYLIPNMWLASSPIASIAASVSLVNTRQILYGASLARFCERAGKRLSFLFAATVTDESFGVNIERFTHDEDWSFARATGVNLFALASWAFANVIGALAGVLFSVPVALASFAMTSIFLCLLFMQEFNRPAVVAAVVAAAGVLLCKLLGFGGPAIFVGALLGIGAAMLVGVRMRGGGANGGASAAGVGADGVAGGRADGEAGGRASGEASGGGRAGGNDADGVASGGTSDGRGDAP
jgi:4-azaleucine resistance transporter AzlC